MGSEKTLRILSIMHKLTLEKLVGRARELADTGQYPDWREVAEALAEEGYENAVRELSKDQATMQAIDLRCEAARRSHTSG